jgi:hypothetical protein
MKKVKAFIVHDETGGILSVARPASDAKVTILGREGHSVFETEVDESQILELVSGSHAVDVAKKAVVRHSGAQPHKPASS